MKGSQAMPSFFIQHKKHLGILLLVIGAISLYFWTKKEPSLQATQEPTSLIQPVEVPPTSTETPNKQTNSTQLTSTAIIVDVKGAVKKPGIYQLDAEARVMDAIREAGGYNQSANPKAINLAEKLKDEMVVYVPKKGEKTDHTPVSTPPATSTTQGNTSSSPEQTALVNLNTADETQLQTLTGIGPAKAKAIIAYRTESGLFQTIDDLKKVTGFGEKTFEKLKSSITVQ